MAEANQVNSISTVSTKISIFGPAPILEGEDGEAYDELLARVSGDVKPKGIIEEIFVRDFVDLTWENLRWSRLKAARLSKSVMYLLPRYLRRKRRHKSKGIDALSPLFASPSADKLAKNWAAGDPIAVNRVNKILVSKNITIDHILAEALMDNLDSIERIDRMITIAEGRRSSILREIDRHRAALAENLRATLKDVEEAEFETVKPIPAHVDEKAL